MLQTKDRAVQTDEHRLGFVDTRTGLYHMVRLRENYEQTLKILDLVAIEERIVCGENY